MDYCWKGFSSKFLGFFSTFFPLSLINEAAGYPTREREVMKLIGDFSMRDLG